MGEPVTLYAPDGSTLVVYGLAQQAVEEAKGYSRTPPGAPVPGLLAESVVTEPAELSSEPEPEPAKPLASKPKTSQGAKRGRGL